MALIGNQNTGTGTRTPKLTFRGISITMGEAGTITDITAYIEEDTAGVWQAGVYDAAGNKLGESTARSDIGTVGWYTFTGLSVSVSNATEYFIGVNRDNSAGTTVFVRHNGASEAYDGRIATASTVNPLPSTLTITADSTRDYSVYATYTPAAGGPPGRVVGGGIGARSIGPG